MRVFATKNVPTKRPTSPTAPAAPMTAFFPTGIGPGLSARSRRRFFAISAGTAGAIEDSPAPTPSIFASRSLVTFSMSSISVPMSG